MMHRVRTFDDHRLNEKGADLSEPATGAALAHLALGKRLFEQARYAEALAELESATRLNGSLAGAHFFRGLALVLLADFDGARAALRESLALKGDQPIPWLVLAFVESEIGNLGEALLASRRAIELDPTCAHAFVVSGDLQARVGRPEKAAQAYRLALRANPQLTAPRYKLARLLQQQGRQAEALEQAVAAMRMNCIDLRGLLAAGDLLACQRQWERALADYQTAAEINPANSVPHAKAGLTLMELGRLPEAEDALRRAIALNSKDVDSHLALGRLLQQQGRLVEAVEIFRAAVAIDDRYPPAGELLAACQHELDEVAETEAILAGEKSPSSAA